MESKSSDPWTYTLPDFPISEEQRIYAEKLGNQPPDGNLIKIHTAAIYKNTFWYFFKSRPIDAELKEAEKVEYDKLEAAVAEIRNDNDFTITMSAVDAVYSILRGKEENHVRGVVLTHETQGSILILAVCELCMKRDDVFRIKYVHYDWVASTTHLLPQDKRQYWEAFTNSKLHTRSYRSPCVYLMTFSNIHLQKLRYTYFELQNAGVVKGCQCYLESAKLAGCIAWYDRTSANIHLDVCTAFARWIHEIIIAIPPNEYTLIEARHSACEAISDRLKSMYSILWMTPRTTKQLNAPTAAIMHEKGFQSWFKDSDLIDQGRHGRYYSILSEINRMVGRTFRKLHPLQVKMTGWLLRDVSSQSPVAQQIMKQCTLLATFDSLFVVDLLTNIEACLSEPDWLSCYIDTLELVIDNSER